MTNRSYEAQMRAAGVSAAIYERKKQAPRGLCRYRYTRYLPRYLGYPYADAAAPAEGVDYPTPRHRREGPECTILRMEAAQVVCVHQCSAGHRLVAQPDVRQVAPRLADGGVEL